MNIECSEWEGVRKGYMYEMIKWREMGRTIRSTTCSTGSCTLTHNIVLRTERVNDGLISVAPKPMNNDLKRG